MDVGAGAGTRARARPEPEPAVEAEPAPEPEPAPERTVYGVNAETYRRLGSEDQQAIRDGYQAEPEPEPAPDPEPAAPAESLPQSADAAEAWTSEPEPQQEPAPEPAPSLPTTPDAAEAWTQDEPADEAEPPQPQIYGVDADLYRRLGPEDQQALRDEHEPAPAPAPSLPTTQDEPADEAEPPQPQIYGVNADLYRRLGLEDQQAIRDEYEQRQSLPPLRTRPSAGSRMRLPSCRRHTPRRRHRTSRRATATAPSCFLPGSPRSRTRPTGDAR